MYVRVWRWDGSVTDRPANVVLDPDYGPVAEWNCGQDSRGTMIVTAAQVFFDHGTPYADPVTFDPPWAVQANEREFDVWKFRIPVPILCG